MSITAIYPADQAPRFATAREALQQVLPPPDPSEQRSWQESDYYGDAVVLAFDVSTTGEGTVEALVGVAILDGDGLHLQFLCDGDWQVTRPVGGNTPNPIERIRDRWREHPEVETLGETGGFVTHYVTEPEDEQFHDLMSLSVATGGNDIFAPQEDCIVLSLDGSTRLLNVLIEPHQALQLAELLKQAAKKAQRP